MKKDMYYYYDKAVDCYYRVAAQDVEKEIVISLRQMEQKINREE